MALTRAILNIGTPYAQEANLISEGGLYTIVLRCRDAVKPGTLPHRFRKWVTSEVIPAIRKTGKYVAPADAVEGMGLKLRKVHEARLTFSEQAAQQLWFKLGLDIVPAMTAVPPQRDLFKAEEEEAA